MLSKLEKSRSVFLDFRVMLSNLTCLKMFSGKPINPKRFNRNYRKVILVAEDATIHYYKGDRLLLDDNRMLPFCDAVSPLERGTRISDNRRKRDVPETPHEYRRDLKD